MDQRVVLVLAVFEVKYLSAVLLHLLKFVKVTVIGRLYSRLNRALCLRQVLIHFGPGDRLLAELTLLDVLHAVVVVQLERLLGYFL